MVATFSYIMLVLGIGLMVGALIYIVGFVVSAVFGAGYATVDAVIHRDHEGRAHAA